MMLNLRRKNDDVFDITPQISPHADYVAWEDAFDLVAPHDKKPRVDLRRYANALILCFHVLFMETSILISSLFAANTNQKQPPAPAVSFNAPALAYKQVFPARLAFHKTKQEILFHHPKFQKPVDKPKIVKTQQKIALPKESKEPINWKRLINVCSVILVLGSGAIIGGGIGILGVIAFNQMQLEQKPAVLVHMASVTQPTLPPMTPENELLQIQALRVANQALPIGMRDKNIH